MLKQRKKAQLKRPKKVKQSRRAPSKFAKKDFSTDEREQMLMDWAKLRSVRKVAKMWKVAETTVHRIKKNDKWEDSLDDILAKARKGTVKKASSAFARRLKITQGIHARVAKRIAQVPVEALEPNIRDYVALSKYLDELEGDAPVTPRHDIVIEIIQRIESDDTGIAARNIVGNTLAGYGIFDQRAIDEISKIWSGSLHSSN